MLISETMPSIGATSVAAASWASRSCSLRSPPGPAGTGPGRGRASPGGSRRCRSRCRGCPGRSSSWIAADRRLETAAVRSVARSVVSPRSRASGPSSPGCPGRRRRTSPSTSRCGRRWRCWSWPRRRRDAPETRTRARSSRSTRRSPGRGDVVADVGGRGGGCEVRRGCRPRGQAAHRDEHGPGPGDDEDEDQSDFELHATPLLTGEDDVPARRRRQGSGRSPRGGQPAPAELARGAVGDGDEVRSRP